MKKLLANVKQISISKILKTANRHYKLIEL